MEITNCYSSRATLSTTWKLPALRTLSTPPLAYADHSIISYHPCTMSWGSCFFTFWVFLLCWTLYSVLFSVRWRTQCLPRYNRLGSPYFKCKSMRLESSVCLKNPGYPHLHCISTRGMFSSSRAFAANSAIASAWDCRSDAFPRGNGSMFWSKDLSNWRDGNLWKYSVSSMYTVDEGSTDKTGSRGSRALRAACISTVIRKDVFCPTVLLKWAGRCLHPWVKQPTLILNGASTGFSTDVSWILTDFHPNDRLAKWLRRLSYISYVGVSQKVAGSIPASIIDFLRLQSLL